MASAGSNDFFLKFGSNAPEFSSKLASDLQPGIKGLNDLRVALENYEKTANSSKGGSSPLGVTFKGLDDAVARMERVTSQFTAKLGGQLDEMTRRVLALSNAADKIQRAGTTKSGGQKLSDAGDTNAAFERGRAAGVKQERDRKTGGTTTAGSTASAAAGATAKEIGNLNSALKQLADEMKTLNTKGVVSSPGKSNATQVSGEIIITNTTANPVPVVVVGGEAQAGAGKPVPHGVHPPTPTATTATAAKAARDQVEAVAASVTPAGQARTIQQVTEEFKQAQRAADNAARNRRRVPTDDPTYAARDTAARQAAAQRDALRAERDALLSPSPAAATSGSNSAPSTRARSPITFSPKSDQFDLGTNAGVRSAFGQLTEETQRVLLGARTALANLSTVEERKNAVIQAGAAYVNDPAVKGQTAKFNSAALRGTTFAGILGLDVDTHGRALRRVIQPGRDADTFNQASAAGAAGGAAGAAGAAASDQEAQRRVALNEILASSTGKVRDALIAEFVALNNLTDLEAKGDASANALARAQLQAAKATEQVVAAQRAQAAEQNPSLFGRVTGNPQATFGSSLQNRIGHDLTNVVGYSLIFTGFEKLQEVVHTGLEAQAAFVRLQASLDANGKSAGNLQADLAKISATTATPIEHVIEAASELSGTFKDAGTISFATNIASQLANISQGTLTAKEAAVGLRDVYAAYGDTWGTTDADIRKGLQATGDQIAHLSQLTGVSVKDITEGSTQIAQEARDFGLNQRQASTLSAFVTKGTGETGEDAAAQVSRTLSTLYNSKTQTALVKSGVATPDQFLSGDIGGVLTNLIEKYGTLNHSAQQTIASLMGTGIQARAFEALVHGGASAVDALNGKFDDTGALSKQNTAFLNTASGAVKQLSEDFQNLGSSLQRLGAFNAIAVLAKLLDAVFKSANAAFNGLSSLFGHNAISNNLLQMVVLLGEGAAAWKLFGGVAVKALASIGLQRGLAPTNAAAVAEGGRATYAPQGFIPTVRRAGSSALGFRPRSGIVPVDEAGNPLPDESAARLRSNIGIGAVPFFRNRGATPTPEATGAGSRIARLSAATEAEVVPPRTFAVGSTGVAEETTASATATAGASTRGVTQLARAEGEAATGIRAAAAEQAAASNEASFSLRRFGMNLGASLAGLAANLGLIALIALSFSAISNATQHAQQKDAADNRLLKGGTNASDVGLTLPRSGLSNSFLDFWTGGSKSTAGAIGNIAKISAESNINNTVKAATFGLVNGPFKNNQNYGQASDASSNKFFALNDQVFGRGIQKELPKLQTPEQVKKFLKTQTEIIDKQTHDIETAGGNDKNGQAQIAYNINMLKQTLESAGASRLNAIQGFKQIDNLNSEQIANLLTETDAFASLNTETLRTQKGAVQALLAQSELSPGSAAYKDLAKAAGRTTTFTASPQSQRFLQANGISGVTTRDGQVGTSVTAYTGGTTEGRLRGSVAAYDEVVRNASNRINAADTGPKTLSKSSDQYKQLLQNLTDALAKRQAALQALYQNITQKDAGQAAYYTSTGGTTAGNDQRAVASLQDEKKNLEKLAKTMDHTDPQYWATLAQIQQTKVQIGELVAGPKANALIVAAAQATDAVALAGIEYQQAVGQLNKLKREGANSNDIANAQANVDKSAVGVRQAQAAVQEAQQGVVIAGIRNDVGRSQAQLNDALQKENLYRSGGSLADQANYLNAVQEEIQARQSIADAVEAQSQSEYDVVAALANLHGDAIRAAIENKKKADAAYAYAVQQYGKNSAQANQALTQEYQAEQDLIAAQLDKRNSAIDLQIAQLNARGQSGDAQKAAQDDVKKAKNALASYLNHGGKKGTAEYNQLQSQLVTARRTAFDTALQAQLDTLDFQQQTYQITSAQEVAALQQILKNKKLTLQEQRDITLKIKNLQESIRDQLTQGGLNIPSDIKLPTAYEVRRSLGAGFGGTGTSAQITNNNQQVNINNNVPNATVANAIANQVITIINKQSGQATRANSSLPRIVNTR